MLQIFWHWFGLMRVCSISSIYFASLHRRMYLLPLADSYPFGADTIATSFKGVSPFFVSLDTPPEKHIDSAATSCCYIFFCTPYFVSGGWILCGFQWWRDIISLCGYTSNYPWVVYQVSRNMIVPSVCRHSTNSLPRIVIVIVFFWSYGLSCTYALITLALVLIIEVMLHIHHIKCLNVNEYVVPFIGWYISHCGWHSWHVFHRCVPFPCLCGYFTRETHRCCSYILSFYLLLHPIFCSWELNLLWIPIIAKMSLYGYTSKSPWVGYHTTTSLQ